MQYPVKLSADAAHVCCDVFTVKHAPERLHCKMDDAAGVDKGLHDVQGISNKASTKY